MTFTKSEIEKVFNEQIKSKITIMYLAFANLSATFVELLNERDIKPSSGFILKSSIPSDHNGPCDKLSHKSKNVVFVRLNNF